jgi:hypothetical protein
MVERSVFVVGHLFVLWFVVIVRVGRGIPAMDLVDCTVEWVGGPRFTNG